MALRFVQGLLTDTGELGERFTQTRADLGITGVHYNQVTVVRDTLQCRRALNSWKTEFSTLGQDLAPRVAEVSGGLLVRLTLNRYLIATTFFNPYSFLQYSALDSNFVVIRRNF